MVEVVVGTEPVQMELDAGAVVSVASEQLYKRHLRQYPLVRTNLNLKDYHGRLLEVTWVPIQYEEQELNLLLVIVAGNRPALFGRNWLKAVQLNWPKSCTIDMKRQA